MSAFAPFTEDQFRLIAMCKARAYTWEYIAAQVEMPIEVVERVAWTHEKPWQRFLTKAERHVARETIAEVAGILRQDIRKAEPHLHATLVNSLSRVLKLQQDFAPPRRRPAAGPVPTVPVAAPEVVAVPTVPAAPPPPPTAEPRSSLQETASALVGLFLLVCTLLMGCWNSAKRLPTDADRVSEPVAALCLMPCERPEAAPTGRVVKTPPPWVHEPIGWHDDGT